MRVMGKRPATLARMTEFIHAVKGMVRGDKVEYGDCPAPVQFDWANGYDMPAWVAAYGPKALATAGTEGDGLVIQLGDPSLSKWFIDQAISAGEAAGRDMSDFRVLSCAPVWVGTRARPRAGCSGPNWHSTRQKRPFAKPRLPIGCTCKPVKRSPTTWPTRG